MKTRSLLLALVLCVPVQIAFAGDLEDAQSAYKRGDHQTAHRLFRKAAEQGNAVAQLNLGGMYEEGEGVAQDHKDYSHPALELRKLLERELIDILGDDWRPKDTLGEMIPKLRKSIPGTIHNSEYDQITLIGRLGNKAAHPSGPISHTEFANRFRDFVPLLEKLREI